MDLAWGDGFGEETQGLDIVGVRSRDQRLEVALVNGITTISARGRYLTILPWTIGEYFSKEHDAAPHEFDEAGLQTFMARVEFLTLACTSLDEAAGDAGAALGTDVFFNEMRELKNDRPVAFPEHRSGSMFGTYFGPSRAIGLLRSGDASRAEPMAVLTPRGREVWEARRTALGDGEWRAMLWEAKLLTPAHVHALVPHFSLKQLPRATAEAEVLKAALLVPWPAAGSADPAVAEAYERFGDTIAWLRANKKPLRADPLLAQTWRRAAVGELGSLTIERFWAEYEGRRRLHFGLELLLSAVSNTVLCRGHADLDEILDEWSSEPDLPEKLTKAWSTAMAAWALTGAEAVASVPDDLFLAEPFPEDIVKQKCHARALGAFALLCALARQSAALRESNQFRNFGETGDAALRCIEGAGSEPFRATLLQLVEVVVRAHLSTTFRKMGGGQKCSLRFFPEGRRLITTNLQTGAGRSGARLSSVIRILRDVGMSGFGDDA